MGLSTFPTNIGGVQLPFNQLEGPLANLFTTDRAQNLSFPSDLASNPTMCHAVQFTVHDWTTEFSGMVSSGVNSVANWANAGKVTLDDLNSVGETIIPNTIKLASAQTYRQKLSEPLAHINLYMPDTLTNNFFNQYSEISLTQMLGKPGIAISSAQDLMGGSLGSTSKDVVGNIVNAIKGVNVNSVTNALNSKTAQGLATSLAESGELRDLLQAGFGVGLNPQVQLLYRGTNLREFTLEFLFTPKNAIEAESTKKIIDAFNFFSLPSLSGPSGQFLVAPQIFKIKFAFTGSSGIAGSIADVFQKGFNSIGLGFLNTSNQSETISSAPNAKIYTISHPCVLDQVNVDYAPNGWAAYNDGHPIQTRLTLSFKETQIVTKESYGKNMNQNWISSVNQQRETNVKNLYNQVESGQISSSTTGVEGRPGA